MKSNGKPEPLGNIISELIAMRGLARTDANAQLAGVWKQIVGDDVATRTRVLQIKRGVLHVAVASAALLSEIVSFRKGEILEAFTNDHPELKIRDLKFRLKGDLRRGAAG